MENVNKIFKNELLWDLVNKIWQEYMEGIENFDWSNKRNSKVECFYSLDQIAFYTPFKKKKKIKKRKEKKESGVFGLCF